MAARKENIVMLPFMAQGHIIPFLALAFHIERTRKDYTITFVNTPLNIKKLRSSIPPQSSIRLLEIPFNSSDHGLPPNSENTDVLSYPHIIQLLHAATTLEPAFKKLVLDITDEQQGQPPVCIIADMFFGWTAPVAKELGVFHAIFSGGGGFGISVYYSVWSSLPHRNAKSDEFELDDFKEISKLHVTQLPLTISEADGTDSWSVFQGKNLPAWFDSDGILFNTVEEFDQIGLSYFKRKLNKPTWAIGPVLLSTESRNRAGQETGISGAICKEWLDEKPENSVLYVSFGSNNTISPSQMMQLATGLEASDKNFIWVVRPPLGFDINSEFKGDEWLPEGFEKRIKESRKGLLVHKWAPQVEILSHNSTGAFLSHCGWNSVLESLNNGVPLIGWAMAGEQFFNVKFLEEELGVCVELARGKKCEVRYEDVKDKIETVMSETKTGAEIRRKAGEVKEMIKNAVKDEGCSSKALDDFLQAAMSARKKQSRF
ncbi:UDP-glycosyltransferase 92A1 [Mercurialis annua]|uniref:UDP-glycosyltransferase 92A1 n=1 Tax=Mercurialis annua TaxID=3986 RepID=UPI00216067EB|nr:UDP-glycosyltransferase 92A1 [Mercurialis annua]